MAPIKCSNPEHLSGKHDALFVNSSYLIEIYLNFASSDSEHGR